jgi:ATP-dependent Zn protease
LYEDAYGRDLTQLNNKVIMDALTKDINPLTKVPYFPGAIASRLQSYNIVMFNHLTAGNIKMILERNIEDAIARTEKAFGLTIASNQFLAPSILFEMGGRSDARNASKMFEKFLDSQLLDLLVLMKAKMGSSAIDKYTKIDWNFNLSDADEDVKNCFEGDKYGTILVWSEDAIAFDERLEKRKIRVRQTTSVEEFKEILQKESILFTVIDYCKGINPEQRKRYLNIMDIDCEGKELIDYVNENVFDVPIYLIEPAEEGFIPEEKRTFGLNGIYDFITLEEDKEGRADQLYEIYMNISLQNSIDTLVYKHQAVKFKTRQNIYPEERRAEIEFFDFKMTTLVESEDQEKFIAAELKPNVHWEDIRVNDDVIEELQTFIGYLKNPKSYAAKGLHGINGVLLYGPPGTGKTSLAKVVATEADISFLAVNASELLVGGTQKVKETFRVARKYAPTVLFIDEIDAVGMDRKQTGTNSVLNTLLTEMDGFGKNSKKPVFVMAATNLNQYLDPALDRRFDRKILIEVPDEEGRIWMLRSFIRKNQENFEVSEEQLISIAKRAVGRSPSELKAVINTAVRESIRKNSKVTDEILDNAFEKTISGDIRKGVSYEDTLCTARHEIGHAITALSNGEKPVYVSVIGRGGHNGYMQHEERVSTHRTKKDYLNMLCTILGGRAAEMEYYGEDGIGAGAAGDIQKATAIAVSMVCELGMFQQEIGIAAISLEDYKNDTAAKALVNKILNDQLQRARVIIQKNKQVCDRLIESLMSSKGKYLTQKEIMQIYESKG